MDQAAACIAQQIPLLRYTHVEIGCRRRKMLLHLLGEVMHVDDNFADARIAQMVKHMIQQGNPAHLYQWLRTVGSQRHHPRAFAGRHDHRCIDMLTHRYAIPWAWRCAFQPEYACRTSVSLAQGLDGPSHARASPTCAVGRTNTVPCHRVSTNA